MSNWNPDDYTELTSPAVNVMETEATAHRLWQEFLSGYFDAGVHAVGVDYAFTADAGTNALTVVAGHTFTLGKRALVRTKTGALPGGLAAATRYYVVTPATTTLQLALTSGGTAVDLTTAGTPPNLIALGAPFPLAEIGFQQCLPSQPLSGLHINCTILNAGQTRVRSYPGKTEKVGSNSMRWVFWIRAAVTTPRTDGKNAEALARWGADSLYGLFIKRALNLPLSRKGIGHIKPQPHTLVSGGEYVMRQLSVTCQLNFDVY